MRRNDGRKFALEGYIKRRIDLTGSEERREGLDKQDCGPFFIQWMGINERQAQE
jgi:hypothetical protein